MRVYILMLLLFLGCKEAKKEVVELLPQPVIFVNPPLKNIDVPFNTDTINAEKGGVIAYKSGSSLFFPPNAFVDSTNKVVNGKVDIYFREFSTPIDFYLSGINMNYDSAGINYTFESAGMCQIKASINETPVFVNQSSKPQVNLIRTNNNSISGMYYLDTLNKKWVNKGVCSITHGKVNDKHTTKLNAEKENGLKVLPQLIKPQKADNSSPVIQIDIDSTVHYKELLTYHNQQFQLDKTSAGNFNPNDAKNIWQDVKIVSATTDGLYKIQFKGYKNVVTYLARPVLEGKDYDEAMKVFELKQKEYIIKQAENRKAIEIDSANQIIDHSIFTNMLIDGFGIWNCDRVIALKAQKIMAHFKDSIGKDISLYNPAVMYRNYNSLLRYQNNSIEILRTSDNFIFGVHNGRFAYLNYVDIKKLNITNETTDISPLMREVSDANNNYEYIKSLFKN